MTYATKTKVVGGALIGLVMLELTFLAAHSAHAAVSDWQKGATMLPRWNTDFGSDSFKQSLTNLHSAGANAVALVVPFYQSNTGSTDIAPGWNTPTDASLAAGIDQAHALGMSVDLKMLVDSYDGSWRANINPGDRDTWFTKYNQDLVHLAQIAAVHHVELITIGTEMVDMATFAQNSDNTRRWQALIANVRAAYTGKLTYGANSNDNSNNPFVDEKKFIGFWPQLDYVGLSAYYSLNSDDSVASLKGQWDYWNNNDLKAFAQSTGKPLLFAEVGYRSVGGAHYNPWDWAAGGGADQQEQANDYEALMSYWNDYPYIAGIYWWNWSTDPNAGGSGNTDYTPQGKIAQTTLSKWFVSPPAPGTPTQTASFSSTGLANPQGAVVGSGVTLTATVTATAAVQSSIIDVEVYNSSDVKVFQQYFDNQQFTQGQTRSFSTTWNPSSAGQYRMTIGVFAPGWVQTYNWNNNATTITVTSGTTNTGGGSTGGTGTTTPPTGGTGSTSTTTPPTTSTGSIDNPQRTIKAGQSTDFVGHNFGHEETVTITLGGSLIRTAHADGGGNFSTGSISVSTTSGTYTYVFKGQTSGISATATVTVVQ